MVRNVGSWLSSPRIATVCNHWLIGPRCLSVEYEGVSERGARPVGELGGLCESGASAPLWLITTDAESITNLQDRSTYATDTVVLPLRGPRQPARPSRAGIVDAAA